MVSPFLRNDLPKKIGTWHKKIVKHRKLIKITLLLICMSSQVQWWLQNKEHRPRLVNVFIAFPSLIGEPTEEDWESRDREESRKEGQSTKKRGFKKPKGKQGRGGAEGKGMNKGKEESLAGKQEGRRRAGEQECRGTGGQESRTMCRGAGSIIFLWTSFHMTFIIWLVSNLQLHRPIPDHIMDRKEIK